MNTRNRYVYLTTEPDWGSDLLGLVPDGVTHDRYTPITDGRLLAHDLVEHVNGLQQIGQVWDEMEALGALVFTRGNHENFNIPLSKVIASEMSILAEDCVFNDGDIPTYQRVGSKHDYLDELSAEMVRHIVLPDELTAEDAEQFLKASQVFLKRGYLKAERKFGTELDAFDQFSEIQFALDSFLSTHELIEGSRYRLTVKNGFAKFVELHRY